MSRISTTISLSQLYTCRVSTQAVVLDEFVTHRKNEIHPQSKTISRPYLLVTDLRPMIQLDIRLTLKPHSLQPSSSSPSSLTPSLHEWDDSNAANWSTRSSMTDFGCGPLSDCSSWCAAGPSFVFVGTKGPPIGSNPGAIRLNASLLLFSLSSSRDLKYASRRAACAASVVLREASRVIMCGSRVNGYTNY